MASEEHPRERGQQGDSCRTKQQHHQLLELVGSQNIPSTSSSVDPETGHEFEVFLSFRGPDIRQTFADCLYRSLTNAGIHIFRDSEELRVGEEIGSQLMKSIQQSKIAIPIFSKDYASSRWRLMEVEEMVKCMKETKQLIMPVFLDVTPEEVQHQRGSFAGPFAQHETRYSPETVRGWRHALKEVAKLKGLELYAEANGEQGKFIKIIVASVLIQLKKSHLELNNILVGIEDRAEELVNKLALYIDDTRFVGVWGMGGIGKTTLAKFVYNQIVDKFEISSFLSNIRETSKTRGLAYLQSTLASDILRHEQKEYANVEEGISVLKEGLCHKKALILLDDVNHISQLEALAGDVKWFCRGSRIIITTRDAKLLDQFHRRDLYEVLLLAEDQALELFCWHAFRDKLPRPDLVEQAQDIVNKTGRLPLALEVIGSHLSSSKARTWESTVEMLKISPHMDVRDTLKISYESLDLEEKEIFLDIACFFIGMDVRLVIPMWNDVEFFPMVGINTLRMKSLIKIGEDNMIWMHDQLRDLGRDIVVQEDDNEPRKRSRLWHSKDAVEALMGQLVWGQLASSRLQAICLEHFTLVDGMFKNLPSLRFLELNGVKLDGNFQQPFHRLRWLGWRRGRVSALESLIMNNLIVLDLSWSLIKEDWMGWSSNKIGVKLKVLNLGHCQISRTPDFSPFPSLEILILAWCQYLVYVDPSIVLLKNLIILDLRGCWGLLALPKQLGSLESLVELLIDDTRVTEIPISGGMKKLELLSASYCLNLEEIPASIGSVENLKRLHLEDCRFLQAMPELPSRLISLKVGGSSKVELRDNCLSKLKELEKLHLTAIQISTLPKEMSSFLCLKEIYLSYCKGLKCVPKLPSSLSVMRIHHCHALPRLPDLSNLKNLSRLEVNECSKIKEIEGLGDLLSLKILSIKDCPLIRLDGLERLESLNEIYIDGSEVERLPDLSKLKSLQWLDLSYNDELVEIQNLGSLKKLKVLVILACSSLEFLGELPDCLESLSAPGCKRLRKLTNLSKLQRLEHLDVALCKILMEIPGVEELSNLRVLDISGCNALKLPEDLLKQKRNLTILCNK